MSTNTTIPSAQLNGLTFWPIPEFDGASTVFGASKKDYFNRRQLPDVPREFKNAVESLFFKGGQLEGLAPEINKAKACKAMQAWLSSFDPAHEEKIATAAYALWVWSTPEALKGKQ